MQDKISQLTKPTPALGLVPPLVPTPTVGHTLVSAEPAQAPAQAQVPPPPPDPAAQPLISSTPHAHAQVKRPRLCVPMVGCTSGTNDRQAHVIAPATLHTNASHAVAPSVSASGGWGHPVASSLPKPISHTSIEEHLEANAAPSTQPQPHHGTSYCHDTPDQLYAVEANAVEATHTKDAPTQDPPIPDIDSFPNALIMGTPTVDAFWEDLLSASPAMPLGGSLSPLHPIRLAIASPSSQGLLFHSPFACLSTGGLKR